jgi:hypothetical protein
MLFVRQGNALTGGLLDAVSHGIVSDAESKDLRGGTGEGRHSQLALPGLAEPPFPGDLLDVAGALAGGIGKAKRYPRVYDKQNGREDEENEEQPKASPTLPAANIAGGEFTGAAHELTWGAGVTGTEQHNC